MNIKIFLSILVFVFFLVSNNVFAENLKKEEVVWTAVFSDFMPNQKGVTVAYCKAHTPSVIVTTIDAITSRNGVVALNGVRIKYLSYKTENRNGLYFNTVDAVTSGREADGVSWTAPMKLYEQTLTQTNVTYTVWSTRKCKGTFIGTPTVIQK